MTRRSLALAVDHRATLVLCGEDDMVPIDRRAAAPDDRAVYGGTPMLTVQRRGGPMTRRRGLQLPSPERFDFDGTPHVPRDNLGRAAATIVAADVPIARVWSDDSGDLDSITRGRGHVSYFMDAARPVARAAMRAGDELDLHRQGA